MNFDQHFKYACISISNNNVGKKQRRSKETPLTSRIFSYNLRGR